MLDALNKQMQQDENSWAAKVAQDEAETRAAEGAEEQEEEDPAEDEIVGEIPDEND